MFEVTKYVDRKEYWEFALANATNNYERIMGRTRTYPTNLELLISSFETWQRMVDKGYFNLGPSASHAYAAIGVAKKVIVEVNESMPICLGDRSAYVHISDVDMIVEGDNTPIDAMPPAKPGSE